MVEIPSIRFKFSSISRSIRSSRIDIDPVRSRARKNARRGRGRGEGGKGEGGKGEREKIEKTHLSEGGSGGGRLLGLMRCRRYRREGCVRRVWCVRCVRCQRRVVLLTAVTTGAPHLEVRTCLVTVIPRFLLYHHSCAHRKKTSYPTLCVASFDLSSPR